MVQMHNHVNYCTAVQHSSLTFMKVIRKFEHLPRNIENKYCVNRVHPICFIQKICTKCNRKHDN